MTWLCPLCRSTLQREGQSLVCDNKHSYDIAKQGYCNLMLVSKKNSKEPGDNNEMVTARNRFLEKGFYSTLVDKIRELMSAAQVYQGKGAAHVLDMGCGEGYYLRSLHTSRGYSSARFSGIDISKTAVRKASASDKKSQYAVASCFDIPLEDASVDVALSVFSPLCENELRRILKPNGRLIRVSPGPDHLWQLKTIIYEKPIAHSLPKTLGGFQVLQQESLLQEIALQENEDIQNLLKMTPYFWHGNSEFKSRLLALNKLNLKTDFTLQLFGPNG